MSYQISLRKDVMEVRRILVVDDHALVRSGVRQVLAAVGGGYQVGEAADSIEALQLLRQQPWDMVLLDVNLPGQNGLELLKRIRKEWPALPVLMLSMHPEDQYAVRALRAGAAGYLTKGAGLDELVKAIEQVASGRSFITPQVAERLLSEVAGANTEEPHRLLSDREFQIFRLIASGNTVSEIAREYSLSVKTVSTYRSRLLAKMGMKTNAELTHYAISHGLF